MFIKVFMVIFVVLTTLTTPVQGRELGLPYEDLIIEHALEYGLDPLDVAAIISVESSWNPEAYRGWATGLGGIMSREAGEPFLDRPTAEELRDPETNIIWTCKIYNLYLKASAGSRFEALYRYSGGSVWPDVATFVWNYWYKFLEKRRELADAGFGHQDIQNTD